MHAVIQTTGLYSAATLKSEQLEADRMLYLPRPEGRLGDRPHTNELEINQKWVSRVVGELRSLSVNSKCLDNLNHILI
jgi:hypothetical protein